MPVQPCRVTVDGEERPGRKWGEEGTCYPCKRDGEGGWDCSEAEEKANEQARAIQAPDQEAMMADGVRWQGVLAVEGVPTGDGRMIESGAIYWEEGPWPLVWDREGGGHEASVVGTVEEVWRDGDQIMGSGVLSESDDPTTREAVTRIGELLQESAVGVSVRLDSESVEIRIDKELLEEEQERMEQAEEGEDPLEGEEVDEEGRVTVMRFDHGQELEVTTEGRLRHLAIVDTPAFAEASIQREDDGSEEGESDSEPQVTGSIGLVAAGAGGSPFANPGFGIDGRADSRLVWQDPERPEESGSWGCPLTVTDDGVVYGHAALWDRCHAGFSDKCVRPPRGGSYARFLAGQAEPGVPTGPLTIGTDHASLAKDASETMRHYSNTGRAVADVTVGEDRHGIWVAGRLRPDATDEDVAALRGSSLSGDWRQIGRDLQLVGILAVNSPGFLVQRDARAASLIAVGPACRDCAGVTAAHGSFDGAVVTLRPSGEDAERLAVDGFEPPEQLHLTLAWAGDAVDVDDDTRQKILDEVGRMADGRQAIEADAFGWAIFNPDDDERDPATVLMVNSPEFGELRDHVAAFDASDHGYWVPHLTLGYELGEDFELGDRIGPVTFDRIVVAFGDEEHEFELERPEPTAEELKAQLRDYDQRLRMLEVIAGESLMKEAEARSAASHGELRSGSDIDNPSEE